MNARNVTLPFIAGNWKMHKTIAEAVDAARLLKEALQDHPVAGTVVIAPPFTALHAVAQILTASPVSLAAQNVHDRPEGAYTGEISAKMLVDAGCSFVIIGHSERRALFGEGNDFLCRKLVAALSAGLRPIFCIGETGEEREQGNTYGVLTRQLKEGLQKLTRDDMGRMIIAYEPVWAIGTGKTATPEQAREAHGFIRTLIVSDWGRATAEHVPVIYGGSVTPANIGELMAQPDIDGALVGGASLEPASFLRIVRF